MANMQHPIIRPPVFGEQIWQPIIQLTMGWLVRDIQCFNKRVHTPLLGYGHYPTTYEIISLLVSAWRNTEGGSLDHPGHLPQDLEGGGGCRSCSPTVVAWRISEPLLQWLAMGAHNLRGWMALICGLDKDQWSGPFVVALDGGPWLEGS